FMHCAVDLRIEATTSPLFFALQHTTASGLPQMDLLSHRKTTLRHGRSRFSSASCVSLSAFLTHVMYARWGCPAFMHPHVCWMLTRARSTSAASEHFLLTQVATAGLVAPDASSTTTTPTCNQPMERPSGIRWVERRAPARIQPPESRGPRRLPSCQQRCTVGAPAQLWKPSLADCPGRVVLVHDVDVGIGRHLVREEAKDRARVIESVRHHEMPHEHATDRQPMAVERERTHLPVHLPDRAPRYVRIVCGLEVAPRALGIPVLEVRHVDVDDAVEQREAAQRVVRAGVVDDRES